MIICSERPLPSKELLFFSMWLDAAVHAYALYMMWQGFAAAREFAQLQQALQPGLSQPKLP